MQPIHEVGLSRSARTLAAIACALAFAGCPLDETDKTKCRTPADCANGWLCSATGECVDPAACAAATTCVSDDGCCPLGCDRDQDLDCPAAQCGSEAALCARVGKNCGWGRTAGWWI